MSQAIQFKDDVETLMEISELAGITISVDYSLESPILKIYESSDPLTAKIGDFILKTNEGIKVLEGGMNG